MSRSGSCRGSSRPAEGQRGGGVGHGVAAQCHGDSSNPGHRASSPPSFGTDHGRRPCAAVCLGPVERGPCTRPAAASGRLGDGDDRAGIDSTAVPGRAVRTLDPRRSAPGLAPVGGRIDAHRTGHVGRLRTRQPDRRAASARRLVAAAADRLAHVRSGPGKYAHDRLVDAWRAGDAARPARPRRGAAMERAGHLCRDHATAVAAGA